MDPKPAPDARATTVLLRDAPDEAPQAARPAASLLDRVLRESSPGRAEPAARPAATAQALARFLAEPATGPALCTWLGLTPDSPRLPGRDEVARVLNRDIARIDALLEQQVNAVLHHPAFQKLEASWRGLQYLVGTVPDDAPGIKIRVLNLPWGELVQDLSRALEFDQSQLFKKVYEDEFGMPGGEPFGVLLGDYEVRNHPTDLEALSSISGVAAAAFAPFIASAHPSFFGLDTYADLERPLNLAEIFEQPDSVTWRSLRKTEDSRFLGLTLPRVLMRLPHGPGGHSVTGAYFREEVEGPDRSRYLWGNAAYAFGSTLIRAFAASGWLAEIRGVRHATDKGQRVILEDGGLVTGLPVHSFGTDRAGVAIRCSTEVIVTDAREREIDDLGFIPLCHCYDTEYSAFFGNPSVQKPAVYDDPKATANARLSSMLQYIFCVSRFAHYLKVIGRDKVGSRISPEQIEEFLQKWILNYTTANESAGPEVKAKFPLREARVQIRERPGPDGQPSGVYTCVIHLRPHFQLDHMTTALKLTTEIAPARPN